MKVTRTIALTVVLILVAAALLTLRGGADETPANEHGQLTIEEARRHARILHSAMHSMLQTVHRDYYRENEGLPIPAATMKDVFRDLEKDQHVKLRWLAVEGRPMNTDHIAKDAFEKEAAVALADGSREFERVEQRVYRRAGSITLTNHCLKCHVPDRKNTDDRTAGLVISIPVKAE